MGHANRCLYRMLGDGFCGGMQTLVVAIEEVGLVFLQAT
jgi:hypothetical protein